MPTEDEANKQYKKLIRRWTFILVGFILSITLSTIALIIWAVKGK